MSVSRFALIGTDSPAVSTSSPLLWRSAPPCVRPCCGAVGAQLQRAARVTAGGRPLAFRRFIRCAPPRPARSDSAARCTALATGPDAAAAASCCAITATAAPRRRSRPRPGASDTRRSHRRRQRVWAGAGGLRQAAAWLAPDATAQP